MHGINKAMALATMMAASTEMNAKRRGIDPNPHIKPGLPPNPGKKRKRFKPNQFKLKARSKR
jgi:hypothetical protein